MEYKDLNLSDDDKTTIEAHIESIKSEFSDKINSLNDSIERQDTNNKALLGEKIKAKIEAQNAVEQQLSAEGKIDELKATITASVTNDFQIELDALKAQNNNLEGASLQSAKDAVVTDLLSMFDKPDLFKLAMKNMVQTEMTDGQVTYKFTDFDGNEVATDVKTFKEKMKELPQSSEHIIVSQAAGSNGKGGGDAVTSTGLDLSKMTKTEQSVLANENPTLYIELTQKQA